MRRFPAGRSHRAALAAVTVGTVIALAACSGGGKSKSGQDTTVPAPATSGPTSVPPTTGGATASTVPAAPPTTAQPPAGNGAAGNGAAGNGASGNGAAVRIQDFTGPASPLECYAPTSEEFHWVTAGATTVEMVIDGAPFTQYDDGERTELLPVECDGQTHTYELVATAGGARSAQSIAVTTRRG